MMNPIVSIGLPVYNGEDFLEKSIQSVLAQDYRDFELIISDNASNDRTRSIAETYASLDNRIRYLRTDTNRGAAWNYNRVFELSSGFFFKWQAHDDICLPGFLARCVETYEMTSTSVVLVYPRTQIIDGDGNELPQYATESIEARQRQPHKRLANVLRSLNMACSIFGLIRSSALRQTQLIGPFVASDYALLAELALLGEIWEVPEVLFQRRIHSRISTFANRDARDLLQWYAPTERHRSVLPPMWALGRHYLRSIARLPLPRYYRWLCGLTAMRVWYGREFRNLGGLYKFQFTEALCGSKAGRSGSGGS